MEFHPSNWPAEYVCPISRSVMVDPVIVSSGHTYERRCIEAWLDLGQTICVKQNTPLIPNFIIPNISLRDAIKNFAISKGMHALPSSPSPHLARALAEHLILELNADRSLQTSDLGEMDARCISKPEDVQTMIEQVDAESEESIFNPEEGYLREEEMAGEGDMNHRFVTMGIRDEQESSSSSHSTGYRQRAIAARGRSVTAHRQSDDVEWFMASREQRGGSCDDQNRHTTANPYIVHKQPVSLNRFRVSSEQVGGVHDAHIEMQGDMDLTHKQSDSVRGSGVLREQRKEMHSRSENIEGPTAPHKQKGRPQDGWYAAAKQEDLDLVHRKYNNAEGLRVSREQNRSSNDGYPGADGVYDDSGKYSRADGYLSSPIPTRYSHSASGEVLLETIYGRGELPPHLVTKPSSYSIEAPCALGAASTSSSNTTISFVEKLQDPLPEVHEAGVIKLRQLTRVSAENRVSLCRPDLIHALLPHLKSDNSFMQINGVAALVNISLERQNKVMIVRSGAVPYLVEILKHGFLEAQEHAAGAIFSLALADENKDPLAVLNTIPPLVRLLHSGPPGSRKDAAMALYQLSISQTNRSKLVKVGAIPILLNLAKSKDNLDLANRVLLTVCNVAAIPEGRVALLEHNAIPILVELLAVRSNKHIPEQAVAALLLLSKGNLRFKAMASRVGAQELLTVLADVGTARAREKALALLTIMKESMPGVDDLDADEMLSRQYLRRNKGRLDGVHMNSSAF